MVIKNNMINKLVDAGLQYPVSIFGQNNEAIMYAYMTVSNIWESGL